MLRHGGLASAGTRPWSHVTGLNPPYPPTRDLTPRHAEPKADATRRNTGTGGRASKTFVRLPFQATPCLTSWTTPTNRNLLSLPSSPRHVNSHTARESAARGLERDEASTKTCGRKFSHGARPGYGPYVAVYNDSTFQWT